MAQSFFQSRAPLSLKNRNSLLMRRFKRQTTDGRRTQSQINMDALKRYMQNTVKPDRHDWSSAGPSYASGMTRSPGVWSVDAADMGSFAGGTEDATYSCEEASYEQPSSASASNDFEAMWSSTSPSSTEAAAIEVPLVPDTLDNVASQEGNSTSNARVTCSIPFTPWGDQDLGSWPPNFQSESTPRSTNLESLPGEVGGISSDFGCGELRTGRRRGETVIGEQLHGAGQLAGERLHSLTGTTSSTHCGQTSKRGDEPGNSPPAVEYSVTCRRDKVRAIVNHLMDASISEIGERIGEHENVTIKLRIDV